MKVKNFFLSLLVATAWICCGFTETKQERDLLPPQKSKFIEEIVSQYDKGVYDAFLKQMDTTYREANSKWQHDIILEERKKKCAIVQGFKPLKDDAFAEKTMALRESENRELVELCLSEPNSALTRNVRDMVFFSPSKHEQASLDYLDSLSLKFKGEGKTPVENRLINIDTEFWIKTLALDVLLTQGKIDQSDYIKRRAVLQLEKLRQMQIVTDDRDVDPTIKGYIKTALSIYPQVQVSCITRKYLHDLAIGQVQPNTPTEEKIRQIAVKYHKKAEALVKEYFPKDQQQGA